MALLESEFQFTGSLGNLSAYRMRGVDKIVVRKKGGASRKRIRTAPEFENTRRNNSEFRGRAQGVRLMMRALLQIRSVVANYNLCGPLNALMKHVQNRDDVNGLGKRSIILSKHGALLQGFSLNTTPFETMVTTPFTYTVSNDTYTATVRIPELVLGINFFPTEKHPLFRVMAVLSVAPDLHWTDKDYQPSDAKYELISPAIAETPWKPSANGLEATTLELKLQSIPPDNACALLLTIGISFGTPSDGPIIKETKYAGAARIVRVVGLAQTT